MARPTNFERHVCVYCQKPRLYGPLRHTVPNDYSGGRVTTCLPCKKLRDKKRYNHEGMLRYSLERAEKHLALMRHHLMELAGRRNEYSPEFREAFGNLATKNEVRGYASAEDKAADSRLLKILEDWDEIEDSDT